MNPQAAPYLHRPKQSQNLPPKDTSVSHPTCNPLLNTTPQECSSNSRRRHPSVPLLESIFSHIYIPCLPRRQRHLSSSGSLTAVPCPRGPGTDSNSSHLNSSRQLSTHINSIHVAPRQWLDDYAVNQRATAPPRPTSASHQTWPGQTRPGRQD